MNMHHWCKQGHDQLADRSMGKRKKSPVLGSQLGGQSACCASVRTEFEPPGPCKKLSTVLRYKPILETESSLGLASQPAKLT